MTSPHSDVHIFLGRLKTLVDKIHKKEKNLIICGDWTFI
jgi:exonuclease III